MNCFTCSRRTLSLFIRSIHPEYRHPLIRPPPIRTVQQSRPFTAARPLRNAVGVFDDSQASNPAPKTRAIRPKQKASKKGNDQLSVPAAAPELPKKKREPWQIYKQALKEKFADKGPWNPRKKLSPDAMEGIRHLHQTQPDKFTTPVLAEYFKVSPEAIRRILKSKWRPSDEEEEERLRRWDKRGERIWSNLVELGIKPPKKWRQMGVGRAGQGEVPKWKSRSRNRVPVNDSVSQEMIPFVDGSMEEDVPQWQKTPITRRMF